MQLMDPQTGLIHWDEAWGTPRPTYGGHLQTDG